MIYRIFRKFSIFSLATLKVSEFGNRIVPKEKSQSKSTHEFDFFYFSKIGFLTFGISLFENLKKY